MKISTTLVTTLLGLSLFQAAFAQAKPESCPSVSAIQAIDFDSAGPMEQENRWAAYVKSNKYDTKGNQEWSFVLLNIEANDPIEAKNKARSAIKTLAYVQGPFQQGDKWACQYTVSTGEVGYTITPPIQTDYAPYRS